MATYNRLRSESEISIEGRTLKKGETVFELLESVDGPLPAAARPAPLSEADLRQIITEVAERVARELVPEIADKIIREEIEKLKNS